MFCDPATGVAETGATLHLCRATTRYRHYKVKKEARVHIATIVRGIPFSDVARGKVIRFFVEGRLCTAMKIYGGEREVEGILFLSDEPTYKSMSVFFLSGETSPWDYNMILEFPDAALVPDLASGTSGAGNVPTAGD